MYSPKAIDTLEKLDALAVESGYPIVHHHIFYHNSKRYTYNKDYIDHEDGSITGYIFGMDKRNYLISKDTFKIEPDGNIVQKGIFRNFALHYKIIKEKE
jgi:hypothetical protein